MLLGIGNSYYIPQCLSQAWINFESNAIATVENLMAPKVQMLELIHRNCVIRTDPITVCFTTPVIN